MKREPRLQFSDADLAELKLAAKGLLRAVDEPHRYAETVITLSLIHI